MLKNPYKSTGFKSYSHDKHPPESPLIKGGLRGVLLIVTFFTLFLLSCSGDVSKELLLFDFESDSELDQFHWRCHTLFSLSDAYVTHGKKSLRLELFPSDYPGLAPMLKQNNWSSYKKFCVDVYNPEKNDVQISVRIDDRKDNPDYIDRYNKSFIIQPGMNQICIPLDTLITSGTGRNLNLKKINKFLIFMVNPERKAILYVDYIRLVSLN